MKSIRCGRGLGDSLYLQAVARHLVRRDGLKLMVASDWPDVFLPLADRVHIIPFSRLGISILAHYASRKGRTDSTQFRDCCINAGIIEPVELRLDWPKVESELTASLKAKAAGRPIVLVQLPRAPMGRTDGFGAEILPDCRVMQKMIDRLKDRALVVQVGAGTPLYQFKGIEVDLANKTSVRELIDVGSICDGMLGYCSFILALAESLDKPAIMVWSRRGLQSKELYIRQITPQKIIEKPSTKYVIDDCSEQEITEAIDGFLR